MKSITLHCIECPDQYLISGTSIDNIMQLIDESGWMDIMDEATERGHTAAICPVCRLLEDE